jgi:hypothetical protein
MRPRWLEPTTIATASSSIAMSCSASAVDISGRMWVDTSISAPISAAMAASACSARSCRAVIASGVANSGAAPYGYEVTSASGAPVSPECLAECERSGVVLPQGHADDDGAGHDLLRVRLRPSWRARAPLSSGLPRRADQ